MHDRALVGTTLIADLLLSSLATREFGAYVPPEVLRERLEGPLARLAHEKGCRE